MSCWLYIIQWDCGGSAGLPLWHKSSPTAPYRWLKQEWKPANTPLVDVHSVNGSHHSNCFPSRVTLRLWGKLFHKANHSFRGERENLLKIYLWTIWLWGWLCPSSHLEGNHGLCGQHNCSIFTTQRYLPWFVCPHPAVWKTAGRVWKGTPVSHSLSDGNHLGGLSRGGFQEERSHSQISNVAICASWHFCDFSTYSMLSEEALARLRANYGQGNASAEVEIQRTDE